MHRAAASGMIAWMCFGTILPAVARAQTKTGTEAQIATREVVDETGRHQQVPLAVHRIVSLAPSLTEIIYALGAEDRLVGVSDLSDKPLAAKSKPRVGMSTNPSLEAIAGLKPDLVLMTSINRWQTEDALKEMGIPVYGIEPHTVEETLSSVTHIGDLIGAQTQAKDVVSKLQQELDALKETLAGEPTKTALFVVWEDPLISAGEGAFITDALRWAGAVSVVKSRQEWPQVSLEEIVKLEPDYIVFAESSVETPAQIAAAVQKHLKVLREESGWRKLKAVQEGHVAVVSDEVNLPAPGLISAIEQLARQIHPKAFDENSYIQGAMSRFAEPPHWYVPLPLHAKWEGTSCVR